MLGWSRKALRHKDKIFFAFYFFNDGAFSVFTAVHLPHP